MAFSVVFSINFSKKGSKITENGGHFLDPLLFANSKNDLFKKCKKSTFSTTFLKNLVKKRVFPLLDYEKKGSKTGLFWTSAKGSIVGFFQNLHDKTPMLKQLFRKIGG